MAENETIPMSDIENNYADLVVGLKHDQAIIDRQGSMIADLRTEIEQLQEAVNLLECHRDQHRELILGLTSQVEAITKVIDESRKWFISDHSTETQIDRRIRTNLKQNAKLQYQEDSTIEIGMTGSTWQDMERELREGHEVMRRASRDAINQRIGWDQHPHESDDITASEF